jgi:MFS family permease
MDRNFWLYSMGRLVSFVGTGVQNVALPLFILDLTGSGTLMGTFMIASMVPRLILYPVAGVIGDRLNRKWIMVWTDLGRGALILFLALLAARGVLTIPILFLAQLLISVMNALFGPATMAMIPDIVEDEELTKANSTLGGIDGLSMIVGPAMGGIIYGLGGIQTAFLVNGASFVASGISEIFIKYTQLTTELGTIRQVMGDLKEGHVRPGDQCRRQSSVHGPCAIRPEGRDRVLPQGLRYHPSLLHGGASDREHHPRHVVRQAQN